MRANGTASFPAERPARRPVQKSTGPAGEPRPVAGRPACPDRHHPGPPLRPPGATPPGLAGRHPRTAPGPAGNSGSRPRRRPARSDAAPVPTRHAPRPPPPPSGQTGQSRSMPAPPHGKPPTGARHACARIGARCRINQRHPGTPMPAPGSRAAAHAASRSPYPAFWRGITMRPSLFHYRINASRAQRPRHAPADRPGAGVQAPGASYSFFSR